VQTGRSSSGTPDERWRNQETTETLLVERVVPLQRGNGERIDAPVYLPPFDPIEVAFGNSVTDEPCKVCTLCIAKV
jgi:hypothetical protein